METQHTIKSDGTVGTGGMLTIHRQGSEDYVVIPLPVVAWWEDDVETNAVTIHLATGETVSIAFEVGDYGDGRQHLSDVLWDAKDEE